MPRLLSRPSTRVGYWLCSNYRLDIYFYFAFLRCRGLGLIWSLTVIATAGECGYNESNLLLFIHIDFVAKCASATLANSISATR